jgi:FemAB-related protein (PEP-CTERM system-associated)
MRSKPVDSAASGGSEYRHVAIAVTLVAPPSVLMPQLRVVETGNDPEHWDRYVTSAAGSTFCHLAGWKQIMTGTLGHECLYLAAIDESGEWRGILPIVRVRSLLGHYLISLPFLNDGGPLGDSEAQSSLVEHAIAEAERSGASLLELRSRLDVPGPLTSSYRRVAVHLSLPSSREELWSDTLRPKLRAQIRRPGKEGMTFRCGGAELDGFYEVFARNMRDLGTPVLPRKFFELGAASFGTSMLFAAVYTSTGIPVAGACCLHWRDELEVTWASSLREYNRLSPNMLLYASLMEEAIDRGVKVFNFGRSEPDSSTHRFKLQWGGHDVPLPWPFWAPHAVVGVPSAKNPFFRAASATWARLPLAITNRLGPVLSRLLP